MMKAIAIAFSTYSKIPMPHFKWDPKALQYSMCAFPLVGAVIGAGEFAIWYLFGFSYSGRKFLQRHFLRYSRS